LDGSLDIGHGQSLGKTGLALPARGNRFEELVSFNRFEVTG
jgi:hypothetical protein